MLKNKIIYMFTLLFLSTLILSACEERETTSSEANSRSNADIQEKTIKISYSTAENTPKHFGSLAMKEYIEEMSEGKIKVEIFPNSSLFGDQEEYENLIANNVQFIIPDMVRLSSNDPVFNISAMPFLFSSEQAALDFWDSPTGDEILSRLEKDGALGVAVWPNGTKNITNNVRPIKSPEDLEGLHFRIPAGEIIEKTYSALGASAVSIPFDELFMALQQGTVDGQENTFSNIETKKLDEVQKYMTISEHNRLDYVLLTNTTFWESLNDPTREIIEKGIQMGTEVARTKAKEINEESLKILKERSAIEIYELNEEETEKFREAVKPVYEEFGDIIGQDIIEEAMRY